MTTELTPVESRGQDPLFVAHCSLNGLRHRLPLPWPTPPDTPPSPKKAYRSAYIYQGWRDLEKPATWEHASDFDLLLYSVDFSGLRPVLAQLLGWTSARGWKPFDPLSLFLLQGWQITNGWTRSQTLRNLRDPRYADYARRFGFHDGDYPTEGGLRHFLYALGQHSTTDETVTLDEGQHGADGAPAHIAVQRLNQLLVQSVTLLQQAGFISAAAWKEALLCPDGMLHEAASALRCPAVTETCYQPTSAQQPRPCPAKEKGQQGCDCDTAACASSCRRATVRDPEARFVWYSGSNQADAPPQPADAPHGKGVYGYRSLPLQFIDPVRRFSLILLDDFRPANEHEEQPVAALLRQLKTNYPSLQVAAVAGDAGLGYDIVLSTVYEHLHARRLIDLRAHATDRDKEQWTLRRYDDRGRPLCTYGYAFTANGYERERQRHKWLCGQACRHGASPIVNLPDVLYPPEACPYRAPDHPHGQIINVGERFADGSIRLVRDLPVDTPEWKRLYHRARNAVESRNANFARWRLKRLPVYGQTRGKALIFQADVWSNLTTLARLMREATLTAAVT